MDRNQVTWCLKQFSALGGKPFVKENPHALVLKFYIYRFYPNDWAELYQLSFPSDRRIEKQIVALSVVKRDRIPQLSDPQWFYLLNIIVFQHSVDDESKELLVHKRPRGHQMHYYEAFSEQMRAISTSLNQHRDTLFMLHLAGESHARNILYETPVMSKLGVDYRDMQLRIMPLIREGRDQNTREKLKELAAMLRFARVDLKKIDLAELERTDIVASNLPEEKIINQRRKKDYAEEFDELMAERDRLLETVDDQKLLQTYKEGIKETLSWRPPEDYHPVRAKLVQHCETMKEAITILRDNQLDRGNMHRLSLKKIEDLRQERAQLLRGAHQARLYADGKNAIVEWTVPSTHNMHALEAKNVITKLESHIGELQNYQLEAK